MDYVDYSELKELYKKYRNKFSDQFSPLQKDLSDELSSKLNDLNDISDEIVDLLPDLFPKNRIVPSINGTDIVTIGPFSLTLKRANPNVPIKLDNTTVGYSRNEGSMFSTEVSRKKERKLERLSFEFYRTADRISHITEKLPALKSFQCKTFRIIRNKLIEHPEGKDSEITYDSFAYSKSEGPYIKGSRIGKHTQFMDKGFKSNSLEFITNLTISIKKALE